VGWRQKATAAPARAAHDPPLQIVEQRHLGWWPERPRPCRVHGAAAAQPHHAVAALAPAPRQSSRHRFHRGFLIHEPHHRLDASRGEPGIASARRQAWQIGRDQNATHTLRCAGQPAPPPACRDQTASPHGGREFRSSPRGVLGDVEILLARRAARPSWVPRYRATGDSERSPCAQPHLGSVVRLKQTKRVGSSKSCTTSEARHARLLDALAGIGRRSRAKRLDQVRLDVT